MLLRIASFLLAAIICQEAGASAPVSLPQAERGRFQISSVPVPTAERAPVRYEGSVRFLLFGARVQDREVLAIIDTGATASLIDTNLAREVGLALAESTRTASSQGQALAAMETSSGTVLIPGQHLITFSPMAAVDLGTLSTRTGRRIGLVLGMDYFSRIGLVVDPRQQIFVLGPSSSVRPPPAAQMIELEPGSKPTVRAMINGQPVTLLIDTGAQLQIALNSETWGRIVPATPTTSVIGADVAGRIREGKAMTLPEMSIGGLAIANVIVQDTAPVSTDYDGVIGFDLLSKFLFALDVGAGKMWLQPIS